MKRRDSKKIYYSNCGDVSVKQTAEGCVGAYEKMGYEQMRLKNYPEAHNFFQHADYYKRVEDV